MSEIQIDLAPPVLFDLGPIAVTNTMMATLVVSLLLLVIAALVRRKAGVIPSRAQVLFETIFDFMWDKMAVTMGEEKARKFFPLVFTLFFFLLVANQFTLLPFVESVVTEDGVNLFRTPTSDYALPVALTLMMLFLANGLAFIQSPLRYFGQFIKLDAFFKIRSLKDIPMAFLDFFLGLLDIVGEVAKVISLGTRLFGNIFAGEAIIAVILGLAVYTQYLVPIPFLALSVLAGVVQAFVFAMLSVVYITLSADAVKKPEPQEA